MWTSIATLLILSMIPFGFAPPTTSVEPTPVSVAGIIPGDTFTINIDISHSEYVSVYQVRLTWDPFALKVVGVAEGPYLKNFGPTFFVYSVSKLGDTVLVAAMLNSFDMASGDGTMFTVTFQCVGGPQTKIAVEPSLFDVYIHPLPCSSKDVNVSPKTVAECIDAYPANRRHSLTANGEINTVYATIENRYTSAVTVYAVFDALSMTGTLIRLTSAKVLLDPGTSATVSVDFKASTYGIGEYNFEARAYFSYNAVVFYRGEKAKTTHFWVLP